MSDITTPSNHWLDQFIHQYNQLNPNTLEQLEQIYASDIEFIDPLHQIHGIQALRDYFANMYENVVSCEFELQDQLVDGDHAAIYWCMTLRHKKLAGGKPIQLQGHSRLKRKQGKVVYHRDYFDLGAMLYQHLPVLGGFIRLINRKAAG